MTLFNKKLQEKLLKAQDHSFVANAKPSENLRRLTNLVEANEASYNTNQREGLAAIIKQLHHVVSNLSENNAAAADDTGPEENSATADDTGPEEPNAAQCCCTIS